MASYYSSGMRVFRGCGALLAPARSSAAHAANAKSTTAVSKVKAEPKQKPKKAKATGTGAGPSSPRPKRQLSRPTGILKATPISPALQTFMGVPEASRADAVKQIWAHIKLHNLQVLIEEILGTSDKGLTKYMDAFGAQNGADKREIYCDEKLKALFDGKDKVGFLEVGKLLSPHFVKE